MCIDGKVGASLVGFVSCVRGHITYVCVCVSNLGWGCCAGQGELWRGEGESRRSSDYFNLENPFQLQFINLQTKAAVTVVTTAVGL